MSDQGLETMLVILVHNEPCKHVGHKVVFCILVHISSISMT